MGVVPRKNLGVWSKENKLKHYNSLSIPTLPGIHYTHTNKYKAYRWIAQRFTLYFLFIHNSRREWSNSNQSNTRKKLERNDQIGLGEGIK